MKLWSIYSSDGVFLDTVIAKDKKTALAKAKKMFPFNVKLVIHF